MFHFESKFCNLILLLNRLVSQINQEGLHNGTYFGAVKSNGAAEEDIKIKANTCESAGERGNKWIKKEKENLIEETEFEEDYERRLYKDDFIMRDIDAGTHLPIGWEHLINTTARKECKVNWLIKVEKEDKYEEEKGLMMFQLPEMILSKHNGRVGKMRIYKSGKIELVDEETKLIHEIKSTQDVSDLDIPFVSKPKTNTNEGRAVRCNLNQEAVTIEGNQITCLGSINTNDILIGYPRISHFLNLDT